MNRFLTLWGLAALLCLLMGGCEEDGTRNSPAKAPEVQKSVLEHSEQPPSEENSIWPPGLEKSFRDLQNLWRNDHSLAPFFREGNKVKAQVASQLPIILAELKADSPLTALREEMQVLPWWHVQAGADPRGERPVLFWDYGYLLEQARDSADRAFFQLCVDWFPNDSIEYFHPSWELPLEDRLVLSMLGSGMHWHSLERIREQLALGSAYAPALSRMQRVLIDDILRGKDYWYDTETIISEIDSIVQREARFFPKTAYDSLFLRRKAFQTADSLGLRLNWRAGR